MALIFQTWTLSRSSGIVAYLLLWGSVVLGLLQASALLKGGKPAAERLDLHSFVSVGALYATVFHAMVLMWNTHEPFTWMDVLVPFASRYSPLLVGLGGVAFYLALLATVTTYLRRWLSARAWRTMHQLSLVGFLMVFLHSVALGPDTQLPAVWLMYVATGLSTLALVGVRFFKGVAQPAHSASGR